MIDWPLARLQHEMFGKTYRELAEEHDASVAVVKHVAESEEWVQKPIAKTLTAFYDTEDLADVDEGLLEDVQMRLNILHTLKSSALNPRYIEVESQILQRTLDILAHIDVTLPASADKVKLLAETLKMLTGKSAQAGGSGNDDQKALTVKILNKVDPGTGDHATAVEVAIAGQSSGLAVGRAQN